MTPVMTATHPVAQCVDLRATFGKAFRYSADPAFMIERPDFRRVEIAWLTRIPCRYGFIAPYGGTRLAAHATTRRAALAELPCVTVVQGGNINRATCPEVLVTFDIQDLDTVATLLEARQPPKLSPEEQERRRVRMRALLAARRAVTAGV